MGQKSSNEIAPKQTFLLGCLVQRIVGKAGKRMEVGTSIGNNPIKNPNRKRVEEPSIAQEDDTPNNVEELCKLPTLFAFVATQWIDTHHTLSETNQPSDKL